MFKGFSDNETFTPIPDAFFRDLVSKIADLDEFKVTLHAIWIIGNMQGSIRPITGDDFDSNLLRMGSDEIRSGLEKASMRGTLLKIERDGEVCYFLNSPRGRAAAEAYPEGMLSTSGQQAAISTAERPNIFRLYEENIGPLTPLIADMLKEAEDTYRIAWIEEAFVIAVKNNKRNWKYVEAILKRWKEEGKHGKENKQDINQGTDRYTKSEFSEYLKRD